MENSLAKMNAASASESKGSQGHKTQKDGLETDVGATMELTPSEVTTQPKSEPKPDSIANLNDQINGLHLLSSDPAAEPETSFENEVSTALTFATEDMAFRQAFQNVAFQEALEEVFDFYIPHFPKGMTSDTAEHRLRESYHNMLQNYTAIAERTLEKKIKERSDFIELLDMPDAEKCTREYLRDVPRKYATEIDQALKNIWKKRLDQIRLSEG